MTFTFSSLEEMAEHFAAKARVIRSRIPGSQAAARRSMQSEAYAYEQAAFVIANAKVGENA